jgi:acetyltransferase-like isoleucine patch superfamily enzyme
MKKYIKELIFTICNKIVLYSHQKRRESIYKQFGFPKTVRFDNVSFDGNIIIGERTYINGGGRIDSGKTSQVTIGSDCAIGRYVHITAKAHDFKRPTTDSENARHLEKEADTHIGNEAWIGDYVFIKQGVKVGNNAIIGAHSVVNRNVEPFEIVAGVPIKHIRFNTEHYKFIK